MRSTLGTLRRLRSFSVLAVLGCSLGYSQLSVVLDDGSTVPVTSKHPRITFGPKQTPPGPVSGLQFYTGHYSSFGKSLAFNIVGSDPALGASTTTVPTVIVPIKLVFASSGVTRDGTNVAAATLNSPIFLTADYTTGATDVGVTQYGDAIQRAQFWNSPGFSQAGYHVLLGAPTVAATVTINVPVGSGNTFGSGKLGVVDPTFFDAILNGLVPSYTANQLPIFLTDNVFEGTNGLISQCCVLGYHASQGPPIVSARTWIYAAYTQPGTFVGNAIVDVQALSHEVSEWMNDPFVGTPLLGGINLIAPAKLPGQGGACIINFETGDPLEAPPIAFAKVTNGTTYHLQDEVFLWWYTHVLSPGVNGFLTYLGTFLTPSSLCGAG